MSAKVIEAEGLYASYGAVKALRGVDLTILPGESVAVVGPSGSGKSTLLHCIGGLLRPIGGSVRLGRDVIYALDREQLAALRRREFGFVFQAGLLIPDLPAVENVALPLLLDGKPAAWALARAGEVLDSLAIGGLAWRLPGEVSGGEAQRVGVARAVVANPSLVLADEPTGNLDSENARQVLGLLFEAVRREGTSLVMVTHDESLVNLFDRVVRLRDGRAQPAAGV